MSYAGTKLEREQKRLLKGLIGKRLNSISYHPQAAEFCAWECAWLEFENCIIKVFSSLEALKYYGVLSAITPKWRYQQ